MPLVKVSRKQVTQRCSSCGVLHTHDVSKLKLGMAETSPNFILLPKCSCGAMEVLNRNYDAPPSNHRSHRKAVNGLSVLLKNMGNIEPSYADVYANDAEPHDVMGLGKEVDVEPTVTRSQEN